jgi:hypothetical protein
VKVDVVEHGDRPRVLTPARMNAPQGARALADALYNADFADLCSLVVDWDGTYLAPDDMPVDIRQPALVIMASKWYPAIKKRADIFVRLDMEDAFARDNFGSDAIVEIIEHLVTEFQRKDEEASRMGGRA